MNLEKAANGRFDLVEWTRSTGSTNADLSERARREPGVPAALFADEQTAGRGRRDRRWDMSAGGGLLVSFYVPWRSEVDIHGVPTSLGVAAIEAIAGVGREVRLKWPNDVVSMEGKKLGGMLSEAVVVDGKLVGVVCGLGCNTSWPAANSVDLPDATNLDVLGKGLVDRQDLATLLVAAFESELTRLEQLGIGPIHDRYRSRCATIGTMVKVDRGNSVLFGLATDIDSNGALVVVDAGGTGAQHRVDVGDVVHLRSAESPEGD